MIRFTQHEPAVAPGSPMYRGRHVCYGTCLCGWSGPYRLHPADTRVDYETHLETVRAIEARHA